MLGGPRGRRFEVRPGDVPVLPAGTGHCNAGSSGELLMVGAYPAGMEWDIRHGDPAQHDEVLANIGLELSGRVILFGLAVSACAGVLVSLAPVLQLARTEPGSILSAESGRATGSRGATATKPTSSLIPQRSTIPRAMAVACWISDSAPVVASP